MLNRYRCRLEIPLELPTSPNASVGLSRSAFLDIFRVYNDLVAVCGGATITRPHQQNA